MARAAADAKAEEVVVLDLRKLSYSFDYFLLCTAASDRRIQTVADEMVEALAQMDGYSPHRQGKPEGGWVLLDFGPVVGHIFSPQARVFYRLERLWADAPRLRIPKLPRPSGLRQARSERTSRHRSP